MKKRFLFVFLCLLIPAFAFVGCSSAPKTKDQALSESGERQPPHLKYIPAQSPYVLTSLKPMPAELIEPFLAGNEELSERMIAGMAQQISDEFGAAEPLERLFVALLEEMSGVTTIEQMEEKGFSSRAHLAFYGIGWLPAMRLTLGDAEKISALLDRLDERAGLNPQSRTLGKTTFRQYNSDDEAGVKVAVAVHEGQLILGGAPGEAFEEYIGYLFGETSIGRSMAESTRLEDLQAKHGLSPYSLGYIDLVELTRGLVTAAPQDPISAAIIGALDYQVEPGLSEVCEQEIIGLAESAPQVALGYTEVTPELVAGKLVLETDQDFAQELAEIVAPIPGLDAQTLEGSLFALGLGINLKNAFDFVNLQASRINSEPFECESFNDLNELARDLPSSLAMIPPVVSGLQGLFVSLTEMDLGAESFKGYGLVSSDDPSGLWGLLRSFAPQLAEVNLQADGEPVGLPTLEEFPEAVDPHLIMNHHTLGFSIGLGLEQKLKESLSDGEEQVSMGDPLMVLAYDYGELMSQIGELDAGMQDDGFEGALDYMVDLMSTLIISLNPSEHGVEMGYSMKLNPSK